VSRVRVLLLDRDPDLAALLRDFLTCRGYQVCDHVSNQEALELVRRRAVDVILAEAVRLESSGFEALGSETPVVLLIDMGERPCMARRAGARTLAKPVSLQTIERALGEISAPMAATGTG
jgi:DNA-binding response OmpR family regulator